MKRFNLQFGLSLMLFFLLVACVAQPPSATNTVPTTKSNTLTAIKIDTVSLDAVASFWAGAPQLEVSTVGSREGDPDGPTVTLQAAYDSESIVIRAEWSDVTESVLKNAWAWDGSAFSKSGNEDRVMFVWPIENNADFAAKGCGAACHNMAENQDEWWMGSDSEAMRYDAWHWKAARTHPVGQADDKWWGTQEDPSDPESSRHGDAKEEGGYKDNRTEDKNGPAFMHGADLAAAFILQGEETELDTSALSADMIVPGYVLAPFVGSRGDLAAEGTWADGKWTVVIKRALDTGHDDDIVFTPPKSVPFGLSVIDDGGGLDHTNSPEVLVLEWE